MSSQLAISLFKLLDRFEILYPANLKITNLDNSGRRCRNILRGIKL